MLPIKIMQMAGGGGGGGATITIPEGTYDNTVIDPDNATCNLQFKTDGTCAVSAGTTPSSPADWYSGAPVVGIGADYDISVDNGATWSNLSTAKLLSVTRSVAGTTQGDYTVKIRNATTLAVLDTGTITLYATVEV